MLVDQAAVYGVAPPLKEPLKKNRRRVEAKSGAEKDRNGPRDQTGNGKTRKKSGSIELDTYA